MAIPTIEKIVSRMKRGEQFQIGQDTYRWENGYETRGTCSESRLAAAIAESPQVFADVRYT